MGQFTSNIKDNIQVLKDSIDKVYHDLPIVGEICLVQAVHESGFLKKPSQLAVKYNNLFGIKGTGTDGSVELMTFEFVKGHWVKVPQKFASNLTVEDSIRQHRHLMENGTKSSPKRYNGVLKAKTFSEAANALYTGGYATDPKYSKKLLGVKASIEKY